MIIAELIKSLCRKNSSTNCSRVLNSTTMNNRTTMMRTWRRLSIKRKSKSSCMRGQSCVRSECRLNRRFKYRKRSKPHANSVKWPLRLRKCKLSKSRFRQKRLQVWARKSRHKLSKSKQLQARSAAKAPTQILIRSLCSQLRTPRNSLACSAPTWENKRPKRRRARPNG